MGGDALATTRSRFSSLTWHTATLKASMPFRTKYLGHVPPKLLTVFKSCTTRTAGQPPCLLVDQQPRYIRTVIYVPPIKGSAIWVWNAEIPTNCTVLKSPAGKVSSAFSRHPIFGERDRKRTRRNWTPRCTRRRGESTKSRCRRRGSAR